MTMIHRANDPMTPKDERGYNEVIVRLSTAFSAMSAGNPMPHIFGPPALQF